MSKCIFQIGALNKKLVIPFLFALTQILLNILSAYPEEEKNNQIMDTFSNTLGQMSILIIPKLKVFSSKREQFMIEKESLSKRCLHYFILCLLIFIYITLVVITGVSESCEEHEEYSFQTSHVSGLCTQESLEIIFICLLSIRLLNYKYHIHHVISISLFIILCTINDIILDNIWEILKDPITHLLLHFCVILIDTSTICYEKYMLDTFYYSYWSITFTMGFCIFLVNLGTLCLAFIKGDRSDEGINDFFTRFHQYFGEVEVRIIIRKFILNYIIEFAHHLLKILILFHFTPNHLLLSLQLSKFFELFINTSKHHHHHHDGDEHGSEHDHDHGHEDDEDETSHKEIIYPLILFVLQFFCLLIYLEIIELNFFGLNKNTKKNIQKRAISEVNSTEITERKKSEIEEIEHGYLLDMNAGDSSYWTELNDLVKRNTRNNN